MVRAHSRGCRYSSGKVIFCGDITLVMLQNDQITTRPDIETRFIHLDLPSLHFAAETAGYDKVDEFYGVGNLHFLPIYNTTGL